MNLDLIAGSCNFSGKDMVMPGEDSQVELKLVKQMVIEPNQQFTIRAGTSTIGTGKVVELN